MSSISRFTFREHSRIVILIRHITIIRPKDLRLFFSSLGTLRSWIILSQITVFHATHSTFFVLTWFVNCFSIVLWCKNWLTLINNLIGHIKLWLLFAHLLFLSFLTRLGTKICISIRCLFSVFFFFCLHILLCNIFETAFVNLLILNWRQILIS
jgi:hypothetical protein